MKKILLGLALLFLPPLLRADVKLPGIFGDHMVLQQDKTIPIWGTAAPGEAVAVTLGAATGKSTADASGKWRVDLPAQLEVATPQELIVAGANTLKFEDVLLGDVWVCSGQSNMGFPLKDERNAATEIPQSADPQLRLFQVGRKPIGTPQDDVAGGKWVLCDPTTVPTFSAVAYYFGHELRQTLKRPIGLIATSWGDTPAEAWTSLSGLQKDPALKHYVDSYRRTQDIAAKITPETKADFEAKSAQWTKDQVDWQKAVAAAKAANQPPPPQPTPPPANPDPFFATKYPNVPTCLFNGMVAPIIPYAIKGVIWYQGESNTAYGGDYHILFPTMISDWREKWGEGDFPFLFVQLARYHGAPNEFWPTVREAQLTTLSLPNTAMASAVDIGDPNQIHPADKMDVGQRLAKAAHKIAYGENVVGEGPIYDSMKIDGKTIRISFTKESIGSGLTPGLPPWLPAGTLPVLSGTIAPVAPSELTDFLIAGPDQNFVPAKAIVDHDTVIVSSDAVTSPVAVRYGWSNTPTINLYNKEGLPASPFRTDTWNATLPKPAALAPAP